MSVLRASTGGVRGPAVVGTRRSAVTTPAYRSAAAATAPNLSVSSPLTARAAARCRPAAAVSSPGQPGQRLPQGQPGDVGGSGRAGGSVQRGRVGPVGLSDEAQQGALVGTQLAPPRTGQDRGDQPGQRELGARGDCGPGDRRWCAGRRTRVGERTGEVPAADGVRDGSDTVGVERVQPASKGRAAPRPSSRRRLRARSFDHPATLPQARGMLPTQLRGPTGSKDSAK